MVNERKSKKSSKLLIMVRFLLLFLLVVAFFIISNQYLSISHYTIENEKIPEAFHGMKMVQISDLHQAEFGKNNSRLIRKIESIDPDIIVVTGDIISSDDRSFHIAINTMKDLSEKYTVLFSLGNHEQYKSWMQPLEYEQFINELRSYDVIVLDNESYTWKKNNEFVTIIGYSADLLTYAGVDILEIEGISKSDSSRLLQKLGKPLNSMNILLAHNPDFFDSYAAWGADLIFSGHLHGGIVRIPFIGGLLSPAREWFPQYDAGIYTKNHSVMIVNRGLGNSVFPVRILNPPEISLITLQKKE